MKTRNGFVSNSSSSSFVIAIKQSSVPCPHCGRKDPEFVDMVDKASAHDSDSWVHSYSTKETLSYVKDIHKSCMDVSDYNDIESSIKKISKYNKDWNVVYVEISYHDEGIRDTLDNMVSSGNAKILYKMD